MIDRAAIDWGYAALAMPGEAISGDRCVIDAAADTALLAVIDGVGHGAEAAAAAKAAARVLEAAPREGLRSLFDRCHEELLTTRGAAMTVTQFDARRRTLVWLGAGNVAGALLRQSEDGFSHIGLLTYGGVVGLRLPSGPASTIEVTPGDLLILATDGIDAGFVEGLRYDEDPQKQADRLLMDYRSMNDDALVLVARLGR
ncbi:MAG TPA: SpoIIE family protein phosphatase [Gammaproteobacteria bacterium]|nr:SpoIIE family protein phosphatase [Gammaproteobacteria bacterium]